LQDRINNFIRIPLFFSVFVLLGLTFGFITFKVLSFSRTVEVPSLTNMSLVEANEALSKEGLYLKIEGEDYDPAVGAGKILRQDVPAGNKVKEKRAIKVVISKGPRVYSVPVLLNETLGDAQGALIQKGLRIGKIINVHSDSVEKGRIVAQSPEPDERLDSPITVLVSLGPHELTYYCPDFQNKSLEEAKETAGKIGLVVETKGTGDFVKAQRPRPGTLLKAGDKIYLEIKEGDSQ
jgi:beta-lactam-binding protein with PASTA domain